MTRDWSDKQDRLLIKKQLRAQKRMDKCIAKAMLLNGRLVRETCYDKWMVFLTDDSRYDGFEKRLTGLYHAPEHALDALVAYRRKHGFKK